MPKATPNPVAYTYTPPPGGGSTAHSVPHPPPISSITHTIAGLLTTIYGLTELPPSTTDVAVLWLLHPRLQTQACMAPFAAHLISAWNAHLSSHPPSSSTAAHKRLIAVSFDQRNHGSRLVSAIANEAWRAGNERHAPDMFSSYAGTAADTSLLLDYLAAYIFPDNRTRIVQNVVLGVSLGGHAAWQVVMQDKRVGAAAVVIGCPDYVRLMRDRARLSRRASWSLGEGHGRGFVGSEDFPVGLMEAVRRWDPAGLIWGVLAEERRGKEHEADFEALSAGERERLVEVMERCFGGKRILNLSGGADKLVPYKQSEPFVAWLKKACAKGGWFEGGGLYFEDVIVPGVGHDVPPEMTDYMVRFVIDTLEAEKDVHVGRKGSREARI